MPHNMGLYSMHKGQKSFGTFQVQVYGTENTKYNLVFFQCQFHLIFNLGISHLKSPIQADFNLFLLGLKSVQIGHDFF